MKSLSNIAMNLKGPSSCELEGAIPNSFSHGNMKEVVLHLCGEPCEYNSRHLFQLGLHSSHRRNQFFPLAIGFVMIAGGELRRIDRKGRSFCFSIM